MKRVFESQRVVLAETVRPAQVVVEGGVIASIADPGTFPVTDPLGDLVLLPGLVDPHVHINEPGRTEWEGFETATKAAVSGGVTTLVDMPLNSAPVTTSVGSFHVKREAARGKLHADVGFHGGLVPESVDNIAALSEAGVLGFKAFMVHSGLDEFPAADRETLIAGAHRIKNAGLRLFAHAELDDRGAPQMTNPRSYQEWLGSRPSEWELDAINLLIQVCETTGCPSHVVHVATELALPVIAAAKAKNLPFTAETCGQYLHFASETIPDGDTRFKCAPPIRASRHKTGLWQGLRDGILDFVTTDHSPTTPANKNLETGDLATAWGGIASLGLLLPVVFSGTSGTTDSLVDVARWLSLSPAQSVGLRSRKGAIEEGLDADLVVFDPDASVRISKEMLHFRHKVTPYEGEELRGRVERTYVRGGLAYSRGDGFGSPTGATLLRSQDGSIKRTD